MKSLYMKALRIYDGNVLVLEYGKIGVANRKRKTNMVEIFFPMYWVLVLIVYLIFRYERQHNKFQLTFSKILV